MPGVAFLLALAVLSPFFLTFPSSPFTKSGVTLSARTSSREDSTTREETTAREETESRSADTESEESSRDSEEEERSTEEGREGSEEESHESDSNETRQTESKVREETTTETVRQNPVTSTPASTPEETTEEEVEQKAPVVSTEVVTIPATKTQTLRYSQGDAQEEKPVGGIGLAVKLEGRNLKVEKAGSTYVVPNHFDEIQNSYLAQGKTLEGVELSVENEESEGAGNPTDKVYVNLNLITPAKLLFIFDVNLKEQVKVDVETREQVAVRRPWWSFLTRDKKPQEVIENYCEKDADCKQYEDRDLCNGTLYCNQGRKKCALNPASVLVCPEDKSADGCMEKKCNPVKGVCEMVSVTNGSACEDGNSCTTGDSCQEGVCIPGTDSCQCQVNADCAQYEDGNLCNGTLYCEATTKTCEVNPITLVNCYTQETNGCLQNQCNPQTGQCEIKPFNEGGVCQAPHACYDSACSSNGVCQIAWNYEKTLSEGKKCDCASDQDCSQFEDGNLCNGTMFCNKQINTCELNPKTIVTCPTVEDTQCRQNTCNPKTGQCQLSPVNVGQACESTHPCYEAVCSPSGSVHKFGRGVRVNASVMWIALNMRMAIFVMGLYIVIKRWVSVNLMSPRLLLALPLTTPQARRIPANPRRVSV